MHHLFWFSIRINVLDHWLGDSWFIRGIEILAIRWKEFSKIWHVGREDCFCSEQDHPEFPVQEECQSRGTESPERGLVFYEEDRSPSPSTTNFEWLARMIQFLITLIFPLSLFVTTMFRNSTQDASEVLLSMFLIPSDDVLESLYKLRIRESVQLKTVLELYDLEIHQKISMPSCEKMKTIVKSIDKKVPLRNFDARHEKIETGAVLKNRKGRIGVEGGKGICYQWKEKRPVFEGRQMQFPAWE